MRVPVTGAYGFIGSHVVAALIAAGHDVVRAVRGGRLAPRFPGLAAIACAMARDLDPADWRPRLAGIDAAYADGSRRAGRPSSPWSRSSG